jgi:hypothetical protein
MEIMMTKDELRDTIYRAIMTYLGAPEEDINKSIAKEGCEFVNLHCSRKELAEVMNVLGNMSSTIIGISEDPKTTYRWFGECVADDINKILAFTGKWETKQ